MVTPTLDALKYSLDPLAIFDEYNLDKNIINKDASHKEKGDFAFMLLMLIDAYGKRKFNKLRKRIYEKEYF